MSEAGENLLAEILGTDVDVNFVVGRAVQVSGADYLALLDEHDGVASDFDFTEQMGIEENSGAAFSLVANDVADEAAAHGVEAGSGFVEEDEFGLVDERLG